VEIVYVALPDLQVDIVIVCFIINIIQGMLIINVSKKSYVIRNIVMFLYF
jgi:hypothetical protein